MAKCDTLQNKGFYDELCDVSACLPLTINYFVELSFVTLAKDIFWVATMRRFFSLRHLVGRNVVGG